MALISYPLYISFTPDRIFIKLGSHVRLSKTECIINVSGPEVIKHFYAHMLEHKFLNAHKHKNIMKFSFLCPATKSGGVLCYTLRTFECLSVRLSVCPSVRPSAVEHSCPVHNFDTIRDNFTKRGTNIKHDQTTCRD